MNKNHFDGRGHRILDFHGMINYYSGDLESQGLIRRLPPFRLVCIPFCEIHVKKGRSDLFQVYLVYPAQTIKKEFFSSGRRIEVLRRLYQNGGGAWRIRQDADEVVFLRQGRLVENVSAVSYK